MNQPEIVREWWQVETKYKSDDTYYVFSGPYESRQAAQERIDRIILEETKRYARIVHHIETKTIL